jgi:hypothetical protein
VPPAIFPGFEVQNMVDYVELIPGRVLSYMVQHISANLQHPKVRPLKTMFLIPLRMVFFYNGFLIPVLFSLPVFIIRMGN